MPIAKLAELPAKLKKSTHAIKETVVSRAFNHKVDFSTAWQFPREHQGVYTKGAWIRIVSLLVARTFIGHKVVSGL
jgi:hypothetical protein